MTNALFLIGLPDSGNVRVSGIDKLGNLIYQIEGNAEFHRFLDLPQQNKSNLLLMWNVAPPKDIPFCNVVVNCITDPDTNFKSLKIAENICAMLKKNHKQIAIFNDPIKIFETSREKIYQKYAGLPQVYIPKVIRAKPKSCEDVFKIAAENNLNFPFLIRSCGSHESQNFYLIENETQSDLLERYAFNGSDFYFTEFVDYKSADGLYRKARLLIIGGEICPRHFMTGESWMVYGSLHEKYMAKNPATIAEEQNFINNFREIINPTALNSLQEIYKNSGLDYLGFDFAIKPDGSIIIFEINAAQNPFIQLNPAIFPYMDGVRNNIIKQLNKSIIEKLDNVVAI